MSFSSREQPWSEEQWEAYFKEADLRAARFGELLETLQDHPDCEEIVSHEMGWDRPVERDEDVSEFIAEVNAAMEEQSWKSESFDEDEDDELDGPADGDDDLLGDPSLADADADDDDANPFADDDDDDDDGVRSIPAYNLAMEVGEEVHLALRPFMQRPSQPDQNDDQRLVDEDLDDVEADFDDADERLAEAFINSLIPAAKIAKGHGLGYDDEFLCGNIVCCKTALQAATKARESLESLKEDALLPVSLADELIRRLRSVESAVSDRIQFLRSKVWW